MMEFDIIRADGKAHTYIESVTINSLEELANCCDTLENLWGTDVYVDFSIMTILLIET